MQVANANGGRFSYTIAGEGPGLVFVHGIPTDYRAWNAQIPVFSRKYTTLAYSRRPAEPNNNSPILTESTIESNASDLAEIIKQLCSPPVNLVGHSYGGFIAGYLAANSPELVKNLVLVEPGVSTLLIQDPASKSQMLSLLFHHPSVALAAGSYLRRYYNPMLDGYHAGDMEKALKLFLDGLMNKTNGLESLSEEAQGMMRDNARTIGEVEAKSPRFSKADAARISMPTLLINGANGTKIFRAINVELSKAIPKNHLIMVSGASHFPHLENSSEFNEKVSTFLDHNSL